MKVVLHRGVAALVFLASVTGYAYQARVAPPPPPRVKPRPPVVEEPEEPPPPPASKPKVSGTGKVDESPEEVHTNRMRAMARSSASMAPRKYVKVTIAGTPGQSSYRIGSKVVSMTDLGKIQGDIDISDLTEKQQAAFESSAKVAGIDPGRIVKKTKPAMNARGKPDPKSYVESPPEKMSAGYQAQRASFRVDGQRYAVHAFSPVRAAVAAFFARLQAFICSPEPKQESVYDHVQRLKLEVQKEYGEDLNVMLFDDLGRAYWVELRLTRLRDDGRT